MLLLHEAYVKAFQYKILNSILYTNAKLDKIGLKMNESCSFCSSQPETLYHLLYLCPYLIDFWRAFEVFWHQLLKENIRLSLQDVLVEMIPKNSPSEKLPNYLLGNCTCGIVEEVKFFQIYMDLKRKLL